MNYPISTSMHLTFDQTMSKGFHTVDSPISRITKAGFKFLDFNFLDQYTAPNSPFLSNDWEAYIHYAGECVAKHGATFNQAHAPCHEGTWYKDFTYEEKTKLVERAIVACSILGIPQMVYHPIRTADASRSAEMEKMNREFFSRVADFSHKYNIGVAIENMWPFIKTSPINNPDYLIDFVDSFKDPLVGMCWDTGHGNLTKGDPDLAKYADQYRMITKIGKRLKALHISDNNGYDDEHILPFNGNINWFDVMRALKDIDYQHSFTYEAHNAINRIPSFCNELVDEKLRYMYNLAKTLTSKEFLEKQGNL